MLSSFQQTKPCILYDYVFKQWKHMPLFERRERREEKTFVDSLVSCGPKKVFWNIHIYQLSDSTFSVWVPILADKATPPSSENIFIDKREICLLKRREQETLLSLLIVFGCPNGDIEIDVYAFRRHTTIRRFFWQTTPSTYWIPFSRQETHGVDVEKFWESDRTAKDIRAMIVHFSRAEIYRVVFRI